MKQRKISQLKARRLQKRVVELETRLADRYGSGNGQRVWNQLNMSEMAKAVLNNTRLLGFHLRAVLAGDHLELYAVK